MMLNQVVDYVSNSHKFNYGVREESFVQRRAYSFSAVEYAAASNVKTVFVEIPLLPGAQARIKAPSIRLFYMQLF